MRARDQEEGRIAPAVPCEAARQHQVFVLGVVDGEHAAEVLVAHLTVGQRGEGGDCGQALLPGGGVLHPEGTHHGAEVAQAELEYARAVDDFRAGARGGGARGSS